MISYQYQILRYTHDQVSGEFVNVGLLLYEESTAFLDCRVISKYSRISNFFGEINGTYLVSSLRHFENSVKRIASDFPSFKAENKFENITSISSYLLPKDDSALTITDIHFGIDVDPKAAFESLYERLVDKYIPETDAEVQTDQKAWSKVYKKYFDSVGITGLLTKHDVKTKKDTIAFHQAWRNGVWNCFQPLSFDLSQVDSIKNKVYKWSGKLLELETSAEPLNIFLLTTAPTHHQSDLNDFIQSTLEGSHTTTNVKVHVIHQAEAETFAKKVRVDMEKSNLL